MNEATLLAIFKSKEHFEKYSPLIKDFTLCSESNNIIKALAEYFEADETIKELDWQEFFDWFKLVHARGWKKEKLATHLQVLEAVTEVDTTSIAYREIIKDFNNLALAAELSAISESVIDGVKRASAGDYIDIIDKHLKDYEEINETEDNFISNDLEELNKKVSSTGYDWLLEDLNMSVGPIRQGDLIIVGARPEVGKTSFAISEVSHMLTQRPGSKALIINNEEAGEKLLLRSYCALLNKQDTDILKDTKTSKTLYTKALNGSELKIWDKAHCSIKELNQLFEKEKPDIIVFNVLDKVHGFDNQSSDPQRLRSLFQWAREKAKEYGPVFAVAQADATAHGQKWVFDAQLYGSKTGIQGEADIIIGIGKTLDPSEDDTRYINISKNKMISGPRTISAKKHGMFEVEFDSLTGRYTSKVKYT